MRCILTGCPEGTIFFINSGLRCSIQDVISHVHYSGINLLRTIVDRFSLWDLLCWGLAEHKSRRWWFESLLGGGSHHETAWSVFDVHNCFLVSSTRGFVGGFLLLHFSESLCIFFEPGLSWTVIVPSIINFFSTVVASDVVQISPGSLPFLFCCLRHSQFSCVAQTWSGCWPRWIGNFY